MENDIRNHDLKTQFIAAYSSEPRVFRAPGRVNLIGEHTDYNDGFVLPCAIGFSTDVAISPRTDRLVRFRSTLFAGEFRFDLDRPETAKLDGWAKYVVGVAALLVREGFPLIGSDILIDSNVPIGAGLSSSASLEIAIGFALTKIAGLDVDKWTLAKIGQRAEHEFAGVRSGIMDQFASAFGMKDHALFLDCRSLEWSPIPVAGAHFVICNTRTKHELADGEYNLRRADCEEAARLLGKPALRDANLSDLAAANLPERIIRRARHVVTENLRVTEAVTALRSGNMAGFGGLMNESHNSLRDDYDVSCRELDVMVDVLRGNENTLGARMTGGGFGGCVVALLRGKPNEVFTESIIKGFQNQTGIVAEIYLATAAEGVAEVVSPVA